MARYFLDTYGIVEMLKGNPNYEGYAGVELATSEFNLLEVAYALVRDFNETKALEVLRKLKSFVALQVASEDDYVRAAKMRLEKRSSNLSLIDCLGYVMALRLGVKFLTGDRQFQELENVEYVR
ncbi:MAG: PIN domain-containing protein [Thaumarchaeota archaeon]|nr:PIN domain-containing protein [Nitrososphaerota archaeon]